MAETGLGASPSVPMEDATGKQEGKQDLPKHDQEEAAETTVEEGQKALDAPPEANISRAPPTPTAPSWSLPLVPGKEQRKPPTVPPGAPRVRHWYVERKAVVAQVFDGLGIGSRGDDTPSKPRMVGLAGPGGVGKSTAAAMVVAREDVRASFHKGVLWLHVGKGARHRLPELMIRLAGMVYETVMLKGCRPPRTADLESDPEDGAAYIREVVVCDIKPRFLAGGDVKEAAASIQEEVNQRRRFLVVADDVWDAEVLRELEKARVWVLYTTLDYTLLPEAPLRLDKVLKEEAEMVLRRAADLDDDTHLPEAAHELVTRCQGVVWELAFVGRWGLVRGRSDERAWRSAFVRIMEAGKSGKLKFWRAAVLRAGLKELARDDPSNEKFYLALAARPKGFTSSAEVATELMVSGDVLAAWRMKAGERLVNTLTTLELEEDDSKTPDHDEHANPTQDLGESVLPPWQAYISSVRALFTFSSVSLVEIWSALAQAEGNGAIPRPYDAALDAMAPSDADRPAALRAAAAFHWNRQDWLEASRKNSQLLAVLEESAGRNNSLDVAHTVRSLARCARKAGRMEEAERLHRRVLAIRKEKLGDDHPDVAKTLQDLGGYAYKGRRTKEAEGFYRQALAVLENTMGVDHAGVAAQLHSLGLCAVREGRLKEAERHFRRALTIREAKAKPGVGHPLLADTCHELGVCAGKAGKMKESEEFLRRALAMREKTLGVDHKEVANTLHNLGVCAAKAGKADEAEEFHRRSLATREKGEGTVSAAVGSSLQALGMTTERMGKEKEAETFYRRALAARKEALGVDHPDVASTLHTLGRCTEKAGLRQEAESLYRQALAIRQERLPPGDLMVASSLRALGVCVRETGRLEEADVLLRSCLAIEEAKLGLKHGHVASTLHELSKCARETKRLEEEEELLRRCLAIEEANLGQKHEQVASTLRELSTCVRGAGRLEEAEHLSTRYFAIQERPAGAQEKKDQTPVSNSPNGSGSEC